MFVLQEGPNVVLQNVQYAMPSRLCFVTSSVAVEGSNNGTSWTAATGVDTLGAWVGSLYLRCPTSNALVVCKKS
jgi:hypothetical protein